MLESIIKRSVGSVKAVVKEEAKKSIDDFAPAIVTMASIVILIFASVPTRKLASTTTIINNYYF